LLTISPSVISHFPNKQCKQNLDIKKDPESATFNQILEINSKNTHNHVHSTIVNIMGAGIPQLPESMPQCMCLTYRDPFPPPQPVWQKPP
jgi:hypothetical protein